MICWESYKTRGQVPWLIDSLKDYIEERAVEIANYIIETRATVRQTAKKFGISKSTVHKDAGVIIRTVKGSAEKP